MGRIDAEGKEYLSDKKIFSDAFNFSPHYRPSLPTTAGTDPGTSASKIDRGTAVFLNRVADLKLEFDEKEAEVDMCLAMENRMKKEKVEGAIQAFRIAGLSESEIITKVVENFNVTKEYVLALLAPKAV